MKTLRWVLLAFALVGDGVETASSHSYENLYRIDLFGAGGHLGFVSPEGGLGTAFAFGAHAVLGALAPDLILVPGLSYWSSSEDIRLGTYRDDLSWSEFAINGDVHYYFPLETAANFYLGGGLAFIFRSFDATIGSGDTAETVSDNDTDIGLNLVGGAEYELTPALIGFAQLRFKVDGADLAGILVGLTAKIGDW
jgi:opacity protein-like surface antigen